MAKRPIFLPATLPDGLIQTLFVDFPWHSGFAVSQKKKNVQAMHRAAARLGHAPLLEVSTKSDVPLGQSLSAFHLRVHTATCGEIPLECAFQGSKVFAQGGPYTDLYFSAPRDAKRDPRLRTSGPLVAFCFEGRSFPLHPPTAFYDWLYLNAVWPRPELLIGLSSYVGFTDIEFNPARSLNCQARTCALLQTLQIRRQLADCLASPGRLSNHLTQLLPGSGFAPAEVVLHVGDSSA